MTGLPDNPLESFKRRNPHLYPLVFSSLDPQTAKRLRQDSNPKLNNLESSFLEVLKRDNSDRGFIHAQAVTFKLANGVRYTPDAVVFSPMLGTVDAYEVKGFMRDDAAVKIKMAAKIFPHIRWVLVWKDHGTWMRQIILSD